jgi:hypothetical protein
MLRSASPLLPATRLARPHVAYLLLPMCLGAALLNAAIFFGIHVAVFNDRSKAIHLWPLPSSVAGDMAVSLFIALLLTWPIVGLVVWGDLSRRRIAPLASPRLAAAAARGGCARWLLTVSAVVDASGWAAEAEAAEREGAAPRAAGAAAADAGSTVNAGALTGVAPTGVATTGVGPVAPTGAAPRLAPARAPRWLLALAANAARGLAWGVPIFCLVWSIGVGVCAAIWGNDNYNAFPQTPAIFAVFGAAIGLVATPIAATLALATAARWQSAHVAAAARGEGAPVADGSDRV